MLDYGKRIVNSKISNDISWSKVMDGIGGNVEEIDVDGEKWETRANFGLRGLFAHKKGDPNAIALSRSGYISNPNTIKQRIRRHIEQAK